jgi:hypothetical protein
MLSYVSEPFRERKTRISSEGEQLAGCRRYHGRGAEDDDDDDHRSHCTGGLVRSGDVEEDLEVAEAGFG